MGIDAVFSPIITPQPVEPLGNKPLSGEATAPKAPPPSNDTASAPPLADKPTSLSGARAARD